MTKWSDCNTCSNEIVIPTGEKGDQGLPGASSAVVVATATYAPTVDISGSSVTLNRAAGIVVTLPEDPAVGTFYDFNVMTSVTSNAYTLNTSGDDVFLGSVYGNKASTAPELFSANAALSDTVMSMNGTTTGGLIGTSFRVQYIDATNNIWFVTGLTYGSGSLATPFS